MSTVPLPPGWKFVDVEVHAGAQQAPLPEPKSDPVDLTVRSQVDRCALPTKYDTPQGFIDWFGKNYYGEVVFGDPAWHARSIFRTAAWHYRAVEGAKTPEGRCVRAREMADEVWSALVSIEHGWDDDDVDRVQRYLLPRVYDCLNLLALAGETK